jgi:ATP-dependent Lon protease
MGSGGTPGVAGTAKGEPADGRGARAAARRGRRAAAHGLPVVPLRTAVVLPGERTVLPVGRPRSLAAVEAALSGDRRLVLCPQRDAACEEPEPADLAPVATLAEVASAEPGPGGLRLHVEGLRRVRWTAVPGAGAPCLRAEVAEAAPEEPADPGETLAAARWLWSQIRALPAMADAPPPEGLLGLGAVVDAWASRLLVAPGDRLAVLAAWDVPARLEALYRALLPRLGRPSPRPDGAVLARLRRAEREYQLREQLRAIRRELGEEEDGAAEAERLRAEVERRGLPAEAREAALREIARLERMAPMSPEAAIARTYVDWLLAMPWTQRAPERLDLAEARAALDREHHGLQAPKQRILELLAVHILHARAGSQGARPPAPAVLCLVGPPGTGKTSLARAVAEALGRPFVRVPLGGVRDEAEIRGHRRTYVGALPGRVVAGIRRAGVRNPVMLLDEIDKLGQGGTGDPAAALLEVLDPEQQPFFSDHYLEVPFDLTEVMFLATANDLDALPEPLRDRLEVLELPGYGEDEKVAIAERHLLPRLAAAHGLPEGTLRVSPAALRLLARASAGEPGLRGLERRLASLCRKVALEVLERPGARVRITASTLQAWLAPDAEGS